MSDRFENQDGLQLVARHRLDLEGLPGAQARFYEWRRQRAIVITSPAIPSSSDGILLRIQSSCLYGEVLYATDCDCRTQLLLALELLRASGGVLIHLDQEGRGAGLRSKALAYQIQEEQGIDTVSAYERLGIEVDSRDYELVTKILFEMQIHDVRLLTNNPRKVAALTDQGFNVERIPLIGPVTDGNRAYLAVKEKKLGHRLEIESGATRGGSVVVIGAAVTDHLLHLDRNPRFGQSRQAHTYERRPGGKGLNQSVALARLGVPVTLIAEVGKDGDSVAILDALRREGVDSHAVQANERPKTGQTVVLQPTDSPATFVGWLGRERLRSMDSPYVRRFSTQLGTAKALAVTLEASEAALCQAVELVDSETLVLLNASPAAEGSYTLSTVCLERINIIVGSFTELHALAADHTLSMPGNSLEAQVEFAEQLTSIFEETTIIATDFRHADRHVIVVSSLIEPRDPLVVSSPHVRVTARDGAAGLSSSIANTDMYCAALILKTLEAVSSAAPEAKGTDWRGSKSPLASRDQLVDILYYAGQAESYVARARAGFDAFPRWGELEEWRRGHPSTLRSGQG